MQEFLYKIEYSKNNKEILLINNKLIHSKFAPEKEGANFFIEGKNCILIFGLGLGYHVINIVNNNPDSIFIVFEPLATIFERGKENVISKINNKSNSICFLKNFDEEKIKSFFDEKQFLSSGRIFEYSNIGYKNLFPNLYIQFIKIVNEVFKIYLQNIFTNSFFQPLWTKNLLYNSINFLSIPIIIPQPQNLQENVAVIVGAGPSLLNDLQSLKKYRTNITIFSTDTALKTLLKQDIDPDFVVSLDGQFYSLDDYSTNLPNNTFLIADVISYSSLSRLTKNIVFTVTQNIIKNSILNYFFNKNDLLIRGINTGGNIGDYVLSIALEFGFKNIFCTGIDFSYPKLQTHCKGTPFHSRLLSLENYFTPAQSILTNILSKRELKKIMGRKKTPIYTDFVLENYAIYFNNLTTVYENCNFYISNSIGYNLPSFKLTNLSDIIAKFISKRIYSKDIIKKAKTFYCKKESLNNFYTNLLDDLYNTSQEFKEILETPIESKNNFQKLENYFDKIIDNYPFLNNFILKTKMVLERNNSNSNLIFTKKQVYQKLLQSFYYIIRILQKILSMHKTNK